MILLVTFLMKFVMFSKVSFCFDTPWKISLLSFDTIEPLDHYFWMVADFIVVFFMFILVAEIVAFCGVKWHSVAFLLHF